MCGMYAVFATLALREVKTLKARQDASK